jgi:hypothetical protein
LPLTRQTACFLTSRAHTRRAAFTCLLINLGKRGKPSQKSLLTVLGLSVASAVAAPAFAQSPPTQAECEKMQDKRWDDGSNTCLPK